MHLNCIDGYLYIDGVRTNFTEAELACRCGCGMLPSEYLIADLQALRNACGFPFPVTSGARCAKHNASQGGAVKSLHVQGQACDIAIINSEQRYKLISQALNRGFHGIGISDKFVHLDRRKYTVGRMWTYS